MKRSGSILASLLLAAASAEAAVRALTPRDAVPAPEPVDIRDHFDPEQIARGRRYARPQLAIGMTRAALDAGVLSALVLRPVRRGSRMTRARPGQARPDAERAASSRAGTGVTRRRPVIGGALTAGVMSVGLTLPGLPLAALARRRSLAIGLSTQDWRTWGKDLAKAGAIQTVLAGAGGAAATALARRWPRGWWLPAAGGSVLLGATLTALAPVVLDPIFNDFTPLPAGETRDDVLGLAEAAGVRVGEVYSIDASRRTTAANAYVTGLGPTKRVVLFDTLLNSFTRDEVKVVVAHELAHVRHRDVTRSLAFAAITAPATSLAAQRLSWSLSPERGTPRALPALALATGIVSFPVGLISARLSRALERRADAFSLELSGAPDAFVSFEQTIAVQNVADLQPPRILNILASHPPTDERIGAALAFKHGRAVRPAA